MNNEEQVYQYPQEEFVDQAIETADEDAAVSGVALPSFYQNCLAKIPQPLIDYLKQPTAKRVGLIILAVLVVFAIAKIMLHASSDHSTQFVAPAATPAAVAKQVVPKASTVPAVTQASLQDLDRQSDALSKSQQQVTVLSQKVTLLQSQIKQQQIQQQQYQAAMLKFSQRILAQQQQQKQLLQQHTVQKLSDSASKQLIDAIRQQQLQAHSKYNVQGVIPGLAWVVNQNNQTKSVRVGDSIPGYGRVTAINADKDLVYTTSGRVVAEQG